MEIGCGRTRVSGVRHARVLRRVQPAVMWQVCEPTLFFPLKPHRALCAVALCSCLPAQTLLKLHQRSELRGW